MKYSDLPDVVYKTKRCIVTGESFTVKTSMIKEYLESLCEEKKHVFCVGFHGEDKAFIKQVCNELNIKTIVHRIDRHVLNAFDLCEDWYFLIEHYCSEAKDEVKTYLRFMYEVMKYMPEEIMFLDLCDKLDTVQNTMNVLSELNRECKITMEQYEKLKIMYLEVMSSSGYLEEIINEIDAILLEKVSVKAQRILYWCMVRKAINSLDDSIPVLINHIEGDNLDVFYDLLIDLNAKRILFVSNDIFRDIRGKEVLSCFDLSIFSQTSYMPSAQIIEELFGNIKKPKISYSESYDCRIGKDRWIDKLLKTNKTKTYSTNYEYEPIYPKEEISNLEDGLALFICFGDRGYVRCGDY